MGPLPSTRRLATPFIKQSRFESWSASFATEVLGKTLNSHTASLCPDMYKCMANANKILSGIHYSLRTTETMAQISPYPSLWVSPHLKYPRNSQR